MTEHEPSHLNDIQLGKLIQTVDTLVQDVKELKQSVRELNELVNKGKGAAYMAIVFSGGMGAILGATFNKLFSP